MKKRSRNDYTTIYPYLSKDMDNDKIIDPDTGYRIEADSDRYKILIEDNRLEHPDYFPDINKFVYYYAPGSHINSDNHWIRIGSRAYIGALNDYIHVGNKLIRKTLYNTSNNSNSASIDPNVSVEILKYKDILDIIFNIACHDKQYAV